MMYYHRGFPEKMRHQTTIVLSSSESRVRSCDLYNYILIELKK